MEKETDSQLTPGQGLPAPVCSPFDALMGQIEAMRDRARQYAEEAEAELDYEEGHRHRSVEGTLNELLRLGQVFKENIKTEGPAESGPSNPVKTHE